MTDNIQKSVCTLMHLSASISQCMRAQLFFYAKKKKKFNRLKLLRNKNVPFKRHAPQNLTTP